MADRAILTVTGESDDLGQQPFTTEVEGTIQELHGYPCDRIAGLQQNGYDVLVTGEFPVRVLPFGKYRHPSPVEVPEGMLYPRIDLPLRRTTSVPEQACNEPCVADSAREITKRLDHLQQREHAEPPGIVG